MQYDPGIFVLTAGIMNGGDERDSNSSKALITRVGIETPMFVIGASVKYQDGIGSESQKTFNNHVGVDVMFRYRCFRISAEAIYDEYGFRRPGFDPNDITWRRSIYFRDQNFANKKPITGIGFYINLDIQLRRWMWTLNYGEFHPRSIGDPQHDVVNRRGIIKLMRQNDVGFSTYGMFLYENSMPVPAQDGRTRIPWAVLVGLQFDM